MVRLSKQTRDRSVSFRKNQAPCEKTGARKDQLPKGYKEHVNALQVEQAAGTFIGNVKKIKSAR